MSKQAERLLLARHFTGSGIGCHCSYFADASAARTPRRCSGCCNAQTCSDAVDVDGSTGAALIEAMTWAATAHGLGVTVGVLLL
jgi:hypothetical protein